MEVREIMTENPACCTPDATLQEVARLMVENDCGLVPIVDALDTRRLVGVISDRDICCRVIAEGQNPLELTAADAMSTSSPFGNPFSAICFFRSRAASTTA